MADGQPLYCTLKVVQFKVDNAAVVQVIEATYANTLTSCNWSDCLHSTLSTIIFVSLHPTFQANMDNRDLPDMCAQSPRAAGPMVEGIHIR